MSNQQNSLTHHGIYGQKWGKRNGPPYPLASDQKTAAERKESRSSSTNASNVSDKKHLNSDDLNSAAKTIRNTKEIIKKVHDKSDNSKNQQNSDDLKNAKEMTDAELRAKINRMADEMRYIDLKSKQDNILINNGKMTTYEALDIITDVAIASLTAAGLLYKIKKSI